MPYAPSLPQKLPLLPPPSPATTYNPLTWSLSEVLLYCKTYVVPASAAPLAIFGVVLVMTLGTLLW